MNTEESMDELRGAVFCLRKAAWERNVDKKELLRWQERIFDIHRKALGVIGGAGGVPAGWKLVPVEADDTMKQAGIDVAPSGLLEIRGQLRNRASWSTEECAEVYRAMIEKSPPAPQAATQGETVADAQQLDDMGALIRRLARALQRAAPSHDLPARALDYLKRKGLDAQILRDAEFNRQEAFDTLPDDHEVN